MQQPNNPNTITNPIVEVALVVIAGVLIIIGAVLLYLGKIDIGFASFLFMTAFSAAFGLLGINLAYKAPSPTQQAQISAQQQNVQQLLSQTLAVLPMFTSLLHSHGPVSPPQPTPAVPVAPSPPIQQQATVPTTPVVTKAMPQPVQTQFRPLPDISMPMNVVTPPTQQQ